MTKQEYNGWTNYETWAVKLWMDNEQPSQEFWTVAAATALEDAKADNIFTKEENARCALAEALKQHHEQALPALEGFAADLLNSAMSEVNWHEIAKSLIEALEPATA